MATKAAKTTTVRWLRLKSPGRLAREREDFRKHHLDPDDVSRIKPPFYARVVTPEHQALSRVYTFNRANNHTVTMPMRDADILLNGDDGGEFEAVDDETEG